MKRLLIAVVLSVLTATLCVMCTCTLTQRCTHLTRELDELVLINDSDTLYRAATDFADHFQKATDIFPLFLPHDRVEAVVESAVLLPSLTHDTSAFLAEVTRCRYLLCELMESERLSLKNLL